VDDRPERIPHHDGRDPKVESTAEGDERGERGIDESGMASA
jgi:hypothetical protein